MQKDTQELIGTFEALRKAPLMEDDYHGPVLFSADAATALVERFIVPNILGIRPELGNSGRTRGEFSSYYKSRVLPEFLTVVDDPRSKKVNNITLLGSYDVDDEGVEAHPVTVIEKGVLSHFCWGVSHPRLRCLQWPWADRAGRARGPRYPISSSRLRMASHWKT